MIGADGSVGWRWVVPVHSASESVVARCDQQVFLG